MALIEGLGLPVILGFFLLLPLLAAAFPVLDTIIKEELPFSAAWQSKEFWMLWVIYALVAFFAVLGLHAKNTLDFGVFGFIGVFLGFPMLLQSKLFSYRDPKSGMETSVGFEYVLKVVNQMLIPGMRNSIDELMANLQASWLKLDHTKLGGVIKNYLTSHNPSGDMKKILEWVDKLIDDSSINPANKDNNLRALFMEVRNAGGPRGIDYVIDQCR